MPVNTRSDKRDYSWHVIIGVGVCAGALGFWGFMEDARATGSPWSSSTVLYRTIQLYTLNSGDVGDPVRWQLNWSRWVCALVGMAALVRAVLEVSRDAAQKLQLRFTRGHTVVVGDGELAAAIAERLASERKRRSVLVGAEKTAGSAVITMRGPVDSQRQLVAAGIRRAADVVVATTSDLLDLHVARTVESLLPKTPPKPCLHVHASPAVRRCLDSGNACTHEWNRVHPVDLAARLLLTQHPLDGRNGIRHEDPTQPHLLILGTNDLTQALAIHAARVGHFANSRPLKVTMVGEAAKRTQRVLLAEFPALEKTGCFVFIDADPYSPDIRQLVGDAASGTGLLHVVVAFSNESENLSFALALLPLAAANVHVRVSATAARFLGQAPLAAEVHPFTETDEACSESILLRAHLDQVATALHERYLEGEKEGGRFDPKRPSHQEWQQLAEDLKDSNRAQASHIATMVRALRWKLAGPPENWQMPAPEEELLEGLARAEHARWCADRWLAGRQVSEHRALVPWEELSERDQERNRKTVRELSNLLPSLGEQPLRMLVPPAKDDQKGETAV